MFVHNEIYKKYKNNKREVKSEINLITSLQHIYRT